MARDRLEQGTLFDLGDPVGKPRPEKPEPVVMSHETTPQTLFDIADRQEKLEEAMRELVNEKGSEVERPFVSRRRYLRA